MRLEIGKIFIKDVIFDKETKIENNTLFINKEEIIKYLNNNEKIKSIDIDIAKPGDSIRIMPVKDVIEPRVKVEGKGGVFPGIISSVETVGEGKTNVLSGCAVVTTGRIVGFQEGIIDMDGIGAKYTPFSKLNNIVISVEPIENIKQHEHEKLVRMIGFEAASYIAKLGENSKIDKTEIYETKPLLEGIKEYPNLPKVGYVYMLQTQGLLHDTFVYGVDAKNIVPTILYPTEIMDGAIISGNCVSACDKNPTYVHMNNAIIEELYKQHGKEINFVGVIITNENVYLADKERSSNWTAKLVEFLGLDGVIISQEGFGNPDTDLIMNCKKIELKNIKTVIVTDEYAGRDGMSQSLADAHISANAVVTGGNANEIIHLPKMDKVIGLAQTADVIAGGFNGSLNDDGSIDVEIQAITGSTNETGFGNLCTKTY